MLGITGRDLQSAAQRVRIHDATAATNTAFASLYANTSAFHNVSQQYGTTSIADFFRQNPATNAAAVLLGNDVYVRPSGVSTATLTPADHAHEVDSSDRTNEMDSSLIVNGRFTLGCKTTGKYVIHVVSLQGEEAKIRTRREIHIKKLPVTISIAIE
jgi:hypothetical protein